MMTIPSWSWIKRRVGISPFSAEAAADRKSDFRNTSSEPSSRPIVSGQAKLDMGSATKKEVILANNKKV